MPSDRLLLGIDVGTTAAKAALFTVEGKLQALGQAEYPLHHLQPGWVEQDPEDWWRAVCLAVRQALSRVENSSVRIAAVAVSSQAPTLLPLDREGAPLRAAMIWMDRRAEAEAAKLADIAGPGQIWQVTGNRPDAFYVAPKLLWFKNHEPHLLAKTYRFLQVNAYINFRLTGEYGLDTAHAGLLQLLDYSTGKWCASLCEACGAEPSQFPEVKPAHAIQGEVTATASEATGLRAETPVMTGTVDSAAAALESCVVEPGVAAEMTGTSTVLIIPNDGNVTEPALIAMPHAVAGVYLLLGAMVASGASLRWFRDELGHAEVEDAARRKLDPFDLLTQQADGIPPGSQGVIFLPYMMGERSPLWHTNARGVFFGLSLATPKAALVRAILEGAAFALRHNAEVAEHAGIRFTELRSVGGGTRSPLWNQIKADVLGIPILLPEASVGAPFGDAILAGMGLGLYADVRQALASMVKIKTRYEPDLENHSHYESIYRVYRNLYEHLRQDFDDAAQLYKLT